MRTKKIVASLIAVFFLFFLVISCLLIFSVEKIDVEYSVSGNRELTGVEQTLEQNKGSNLLFLDTQKILDEFKKHPYFEITSIEKRFPNVLKVSVKERIETYYFSFNNEVYVTTEDGVLLNVVDKSNLPAGQDRGIINVELDGVEILSKTLNEKIKSNNLQLLDSLFEMAKAVDLTDCIKGVKVVSKPEMNDVVFNTYTGVKIVVYKAQINGVEKAKQAFLQYVNGANDYQKLNNVISVSQTDDGKITVTWESKGEIN